MDYLPVFLDLRDRLCAVVGGNATAARKAELLLSAGARVRVLADGLEEALARQVREGRVSHVAAPLGADAFDGCCLAVIALHDEPAARHAAALARERGIPVNAVDRPDLCTFIMPAIVDRSPVVLAVSTAGAAPVLGRFLRARLEAMLPARLGRLAEIARSLRGEVGEALPAARRRAFWEGVLQGPIAEQVFAGDEDGARAAMRERLAGTPASAGGEIYLVATPPGGDPERVTLRALRLLQQADVVLHDPALPRAVLDLIRRDAERHAHDPGTGVEPVLQRLLALAAQGRRACWFTAPGTLRPDNDAPAARKLAARGASVLSAD